jgi:DNA invertase Pin-like site-specific DNA recombinase
MDFLKMLAELRTERLLIDQAILALEQLARGGGKRRGRPPKALAQKRRGRPPGTKLSAAARKALSERMKKYWAARRKQKPA